jgi:hypothetical protein
MATQGINFGTRSVVGLRHRAVVSARLRAYAQRTDVPTTLCGGSFPRQLRHARTTFVCDRATSWRVLTEVSNAWHAPAMLTGTLRARSLARLADGWTSSHARRRMCGLANTGPRKRGRIQRGWAIRLRWHVHGTVGGTVTGRWRASVDRVERSLAVISSRNGERCSRAEEALQEV